LEWNIRYLCNSHAMNDISPKQLLTL